MAGSRPASSLPRTSGGSRSTPSGATWRRSRRCKRTQRCAQMSRGSARLPMKPIDEQSWDEFSTHWNTDVKAGLVGIQAALKVPMTPGGRILIMSSGASMVLSAPQIEPESLRLSGGYVGAKRMLWFMAHCANPVSRDRGLQLHFQVLVPSQVLPDPTLRHLVAAAHAELEGLSAEEHVMQRYGSIMRPADFGQRVTELLADPHYASGVAYGFRANASILPPDARAARS